MEIKEFMYFYPERPTLMSVEQELFNSLSADEKWIAEPKYNGARLQLHRSVNGVWQFWGRHERLLSFNAPYILVDSLCKLELSGYNLFDGELRHNKVRGVQNKIVIYDIFIYQNKLLLGMPFHKRREVLKGLVRNDENISLIEQFPNDFRKHYDRLIKDPEIEGLVIKNINGKLALGRRSASESLWMKKVRRKSNNYAF